ncbi:MAG TPA: RNA-binding S4 domain-containing protein [Solirubrobacteraceae bacterium]|nr:RNA-binding S4 domain-containing protein [Solirubrobacteraceae bacterium]
MAPVEVPQPIAPRDVAIRGEMIRLGQLLKLAGAVSSGSEVKLLLAEGQLLVNGEPESRRGRQLHPGDIVRVHEDELRVVRGGA